MGNYEYIISSLPVPDKDARSGGVPAEELIAFIRSQLSKKDNALVDLLLRGHDETTLGEEFYREALADRDRFIREYFRFDLNLRNAKVRFLNKALGRPEGQDIFLEPEGVFEEKERVEAVLALKDILARERGIDDIRWEKILALTVFNYFDIDAVLGFIARMLIIGRWVRLDDRTGREMFRRLVEEVRGTFQGVRFNDK